MTFDIASIRADFPILSREVNGKPLVYLDNGASSQKPQVVIDAVTQAYAHEYANVHRGLHYLSNLATDKYEGVRGVVARFLNAGAETEIVLNSGTTEGINAVAYGWAMQNLTAGDEIILSVMEHHANIVPWHFLRERYGVVLKWVDIDAQGNLDPQAVIDAISERSKLIAITHMSNVLGSVVDVKTICHHARSRGVPVLVDGSQAAVHHAVDVQDIGCDFYAITGHKLCGPSGSGAIFMRAERMAEMRPFIGGGDMIKEVRLDGTTYNDLPYKFEAGTPNIAGNIGLGKALEYILSLNLAAAAKHENDLLAIATSRMQEIDGATIIGTAANKTSVLSFILADVHPHDLGTLLDNQGVAIRTGHHCAMPVMQRFGLEGTARASFALYNNEDDLEQFFDALNKAVLMLR